uniref:TRC8-like N-terminal domain-containing protein n=1 Tax=Megaselia scalaris TaxID=36166 RepID=T1GCY6_MEGSC
MKLALEIMKFILDCEVSSLVSSACIFMLWTRHLVIVYMFLASVGLIFLSYWSNVSALTSMDNGTYLIEDLLSLNMNRLLDPGGVAISILPHLVAQWFMGFLF